MRHPGRYRTRSERRLGEQRVSWPEQRDQGRGVAAIAAEHDARIAVVTARDAECERLGGVRHRSYCDLERAGFVDGLAARADAADHLGARQVADGEGDGELQLGEEALGPARRRGRRGRGPRPRRAAEMAPAFWRRMRARRPPPTPSHWGMAEST